jgi:hypothetical protein
MLERCFTTASFGVDSTDRMGANGPGTSVGPAD